MREIKFRAWQKHHRKMLPVKIIDFNRNTITVDYGEKTIPRFNTFDMENFELMQYTGLKDKYGKEIYEGDIVTEIYEGDIIFRPNEVGRIEFSEDGSFLIRFPHHLARLNATWKPIEVIGNIYENPELLGGAE